MHDGKRQVTLGLRELWGGRGGELISVWEETIQRPHQHNAMQEGNSVLAAFLIFPREAGNPAVV